MDRESRGNLMGMGIKRRFGNGNGREWETTSVGMGITCSSNGNLFPKVLCCDELIKLLVLYLPDASAYCAEFADYRNVIYSAPRAGRCIVIING